jgi:hypothetical protein
MFGQGHTRLPLVLRAANAVRSLGSLAMTPVSEAKAEMH